MRKTTTTISANAKLTGFNTVQEFNATQNCYWDGTGQTFVVTTATNDPVRVKFNCTIKFTLTTHNNGATVVMRDFTNSTNYDDTTMVCVQGNHNGTFERSFTVIKSFNTNRLVGLWVATTSGTPPFSALDITFTAETVFTSVAVNRLSNADGTYSLQMATGGINLIGADQDWFLNGA